MSPTARLWIDALLAAVPVGAILWARGRHGERRARPSPGRFFLLYALLFALLLTVTRVLGLGASLFAGGLLIGLLGAGRGVATMYRLLYGGSWLERNPDVPRHDALMWQLPLLVVAVLAFATGMVAATQGW